MKMKKSKKAKGLKKFYVSVERCLHVSGRMEVEAKTADEAEQEVQRMMDANTDRLQTSDPRISWGEPCYEDGSFQTTGDVEESA